MPSREDSEFIEQAKRRFDLASEADRAQRERELSDLKAYAGDIWSSEDLQARGPQPGIGGLPGLPARPSMRIPLVQEPIRQITNEERSAELGIEIAPADDFGDVSAPADETEIELREGLVRRIQRDSEAAAARSWAFARAVQAGRGFWCVMTRYLPGKTWDQEVYVQQLYDQSSVRLDPAHEQPDGSDASYGFIGNDYVSWDEYKQRWPKNARGERNPAAGSTDTFQALKSGDPEWFRSDGKEKYVRICDYWYTTLVPRELALLPDGSVAWMDELPKGTPTEDTREVLDREVRWCKLDGLQVLEKTDWLSPDIPIIKEVGEELQPYDQERRAQGVVRPSRDSVLAFNAMVSKLVETIGLTPIPPFQATPDQIEGFEQMYQLAATRAMPVLYYNLVSDGGKPLGPPTRTPIDTPVAAIAGAIQLFRETIQSTTAVHDPSLGRVDPSIKSGRAIKFLQQQSQHATSNFLSNHQRSLRREGHIINSLLYNVYGKRPGRMARIISPDGEAQTVAINGMPNGNGRSGAPIKQYKLTEGGNFNVIVKVGRAFESRRQEEAAMIGDLISANPALMTVIGDLFLKNSDGPGSLEMSERLKVMLDPRVQQLIDSKKQGSQIPPQIQSQMGQMSQQIKEAEGIMAQQQRDLDTKKIENETKVTIAQMEIASKEKIAALDRETKITVAELGAKVERLELFMEERARLGAQLHEQEQGELSRQHEQQMAASGQAHDAALTSMQQAQEAERMQTEHQNALEQQQQAADLAPEPEPTA